MSLSKDVHLFSTNLKVFLLDGIIFWLVIVQTVCNRCVWMGKLLLNRVIAGFRPPRPGVVPNKSVTPAAAAATSPLIGNVLAAAAVVAANTASASATTTSSHQATRFANHLHELRSNFHDSYVTIPPPSMSLPMPMQMMLQQQLQILKVIDSLLLMK